MTDTGLLTFTGLKKTEPVSQKEILDACLEQFKALELVNYFHKKIAIGKVACLKKHAPSTFIAVSELFDLLIESRLIEQLHP